MATLSDIYQKISAALAAGTFGAATFDGMKLLDVEDREWREFLKHAPGGEGLLLKIEQHYKEYVATESQAIP